MAGEVINGIAMHFQRDGSWLADDGYRAQREVAYLTGRWDGDWHLRDPNGKVVDVTTHLSDLMRRNGYRLADFYGANR